MTDQGVSIIIPTYREAANLPLLIEKIANLADVLTPFEVVVVDDDSQHGTADVIAQLRLRYPWLQGMTRHGQRSWDQSILQGMRAARYAIFVFMDADLSHPPERIPEMITRLRQPEVDLVIGSRYMQGGQIDKTWPWYRQCISRLATWVIQPLLPNAITDPLSGFIALKKSIYTQFGAHWKPIGTKLALEVIVKSDLQLIVEIPICFEQRKQGESKLMTLHMARKYARQVVRLWWGR